MVTAYRCDAQLQQQVRHVVRHEINESCLNVNESCPAITKRILSLWCTAATTSATRRGTRTTRAAPAIAAKLLQFPPKTGWHLAAVCRCGYIFISIYMCMCICMCMRVCIYTYIYRLRASAKSLNFLTKRAFIHKSPIWTALICNKNTFKCICIYTFMYIKIYRLRAGVNMYVYEYICVCEHVYICVFLRVHVHIYIGCAQEWHRSFSFPSQIGHFFERALFEERLFAVECV